MKKLLLLGVLAASIVPAYADGFNDCFRLTYEGETLTDGQTININNYWDPILMEYPEMADDPDWPSSFYTEADIRATNIGEEPRQLQFSLKVISPAADQFPLFGPLGNVALCYDYESAPGTCLNVQDGVLDFTSNIDPVPAEEYIKMLVEQRDITDEGIGTDVSVQLDMRAMEDDEVIGTSTIYINFTHKKDITLAVEGIEAVNAPAEYFTIQGLKVAQPQKGQLYIERKGGKAIKRIF